MFVIVNTCHVARVLRHAWACATLVATAITPAAAQSLTPAGERPPVAFGMSWNFSAFANARGGAQTGATATSNLNANVAADLSSLVGWHDATAYADVLWVQGGQPSALAGDAQGVSNISAPNALKLYEAWLERNFAGNRLSALIGLYDLSAEFDRLQGAGLFLNSSFGTGPEFSQSGVAGPSIFPNTSIGARFAAKPTANIVLRVALLNGAPVDRPQGSEPPTHGGSGALWVAEAAWIDRPLAPNRAARPSMRIGRRAGLGDYSAKTAFGLWHYTASFADLSDTTALGEPVLHRGSTGAYVVAESTVWSRGAQPRVDGFVQLGVGDRNVDRFGSYAGVGLVASGMTGRRPNDEFGVAAAIARNGSHYVAAQHAHGVPVTSAETALELTYRIVLSDAISLQPDIEYVIHPGTTPSRANALTAQLRLQASF